MKSTKYLAWGNPPELGTEKAIGWFSSLPFAEDACDVRAANGWVNLRISEYVSGNLTQTWIMKD